ncbi:MAG: DHHA1 domain-containing protein, partial [Candidatus Puniceispirillaceae bacterium]
DEVIICVNQTPFYGESGGQVGDTGVMGWTDGSAVVTNTVKTAGLVLHHVRIHTGTLALGQAVSLKVDASRRAGLRAHHSATHLLHEALRQVLGDHVAQKGSLVTDTRLRFDFSHPKAMTNEETSAVEALVNDRIRMNSQVATKIMAPDEAINEGALALFGEKYGDEVRVVSMGGVADQVGRSAWSVELCGGTHVDQTGDIALLHVISESAVAGGVRRIEAATHAAGFAGLVANKAILSELSVELKTPPDQLASRVAQLLEERKALEREVTKLRRQMATGSGTAEAEQIGNLAYIARILPNTPAKDLKAMADQFRQGVASSVICLVATDENKASCVVSVTDDLTATHNAVDLVRLASAALGGKGGGGRADMAQAGGPEAGQADAAIAAVRAALAG